MTDYETLKAEFDARRTAYFNTAHDMSVLIPKVVAARIREVFPNAVRLRAFGEVNEDGTPILRIRRIELANGWELGPMADGPVLHEIDGVKWDDLDQLAEDLIDELDGEYLDWLIDLNGDDYFGDQEFDLEQELSNA